MLPDRKPRQWDISSNSMIAFQKRRMGNRNVKKERIFETSTEMGFGITREQICTEEV